MPSSIKLHLAQDHDENTWNSIVSSSVQGTLFHQWRWLRITEKHTGTKLYPLIGMRDHTPIGVFPLFFQEKGPVRMVFSPPPRVSLPYLGPVLADYDILKQEKKEKLYVRFQELVDEFITCDLRANYINISLPPELDDPRPFSWTGYTVKPYFDYSVDTTQGAEQLLKSLDYNKRSDLKKAGERGITIGIGGKKEYEIILDLMNVRYAQQSKFFTASRQFFLEVFDNYRERMKIFYVTVDGEVVTGIICIIERDSLYGWFGNSKPHKQITPSPNHILFWEIVRYASENGLKKYLITGAAGNERLHEFYAARFNPELKIRYAAVKKTLLTGAFERGYTDILKPLRGKLKRLEPAL